MIQLGPVTSTAGTTYQAADVQALVQRPGYKVRWFFDLLDDQRVPIDDLTPYVDPRSPAEFRHDSGRAVKRELVLTMRASPTMDYRRHLIRTRFEVLAPDGGWLDWIVGLGCATPPKLVHYRGYTRWTMTVPDLSQLLNDADMDYSGSILPGTDIVGQVASLAAGYGGRTQLPVSIVDPGSKLPAALSYAQGDSLLKVINNLLSSIAYVPAWANADGVLVSRPQPDYAALTPAILLDAVAGGATIIPTGTGGGLEDEPEEADAANIVIVKAQDPSRTPITARHENARADSPVSLIATGRPKYRIVDDSNISSQAAADQRAYAEAQDAAQVFSVLTVGTPGPFPWFEDLDVVGLTYQGAEGVVSANYVVVAGTMSCSGQPTVGKLRRIVAA